MEDPSVGLMGCNIIFSHAHEKQTTYGSDDTSHWFTCYESGCDKQYETEEHTFGTWIVDKEATKTASGSKHRECSVCHRKVHERIPKIGEIVPTPTPEEVHRLREEVRRLREEVHRLREEAHRLREEVRRYREEVHRYREEA